MRVLAVLLVLVVGAVAQEAPRCEVEKLSPGELKTLELLTSVVAYGMLCGEADFEAIYSRGCGEMVKPMKLQHRDPRKEPGYTFGFERPDVAVRTWFEPKKAGAPGFLAVDEMLYCNPAGKAEEKEEQLLGQAPDVDEQIQAAKKKQKKAGGK